MISNSPLHALADQQVKAIAQLQRELASIGVRLSALAASIGGDEVPHDITAAEAITKADAQFKRVVSVVSEVFQVPRREIMGRLRIQDVAFARQVCMYILRETTPWSLAQIGSAFFRDHGTVIHATRAVVNACATDKSIAELVSRCRAELLRTAPSSAAPNSNPKP